MEIYSFRGMVASLMLLGFPFTTTGAQTSTVLFSEDFSAGLKPIWKAVDFEGKTVHTIQREGTNSFLQARAASSASGLAVKFNGEDAAGGTLSWKWKIDQVPPGGSDDNIKTFDHTARVFVAFKTFIGPPRTINYVWANTVPEGKTFHHPSSGRSRFIVLQSGNQRAGKWLIEKRDLLRDWQTLFGDDKPPAIVGLGFMTDSDGTRAEVTGSYDDFRLTSRK